MKNKLCDICGSDKYVQQYQNTKMFLCAKHRTQMDRNGEIKRTKYDSNIFKIDVKRNIVLMKIYDINGRYKAKTIFNLQHLEKVKEYKWCLGYKGNILTRVNGKMLKLHRLIAGVKEGDMVRHISKNLLNNLDDNLKVIQK